MKCTFVEHEIIQIFEFWSNIDEFILRIRACV